MGTHRTEGLVKNKLFGVLGLFCTRVRTHKNIFKLLQRLTSLFRTHFQYLDKRNCMKQCVSTHFWHSFFTIWELHKLLQPAKNFIGNCESRYYFFGIPLGTKNCPCSKFGTPTPRNTTDDFEFTDGLETRRVGWQD